MNQTPGDASMSRSEERAFHRGFEAGDKFRSENPPKKWRELEAAAREAIKWLQYGSAYDRLLKALEKVS